MYPTKKLWEILDKTKFTIWKIKTSDYLPSWKNPIIDQWKSLIAWYSNKDELVYHWKLPVIVYWDHTNIVKYVDFPFIWWADWIKVLPFNNNCDVKYCYYLLENFKPETQWYRRHFSFFKEINLPTPPLSTQKLIVQKLNSAFENIDKNINLTKENLKNLEDLNKSVLEKVFSEWEYEMKKLWDLFDITSSKRVFKSEWENKWIPFYRAREIVKLAKNWFVDNELFITDEMFNEYSLKYWAPKQWDIMITWVWTLWIPYVVKENDKFYFKDWNIIWLKTIWKEVFSKYVEYGFYSNFIKKQVSNTSWTSVWTYTIIRAKETIIPLPPLQKQKEIVLYLDQVFAKNKELKTKYELQLKELEELKQSLLKDAFDGRLVKE